ncbi:hypothetical protein ACWDE0_22040 [Streptomyces sp. 900105755]
MTELRWHYGPADDDPTPVYTRHTGCPAGSGLIMFDVAGDAYCRGCGAKGKLDCAGSVRPDEEPT